MNLFLLNILLALAWGFVTGSFTIASLAFGFALGYVALWLPRRLWGETKYFRRLYLILRLVFVFLYELALSGWTVAKIVLKPGRDFRSAIIAVPLEAKTGWEITTFANLITLTPGTLTIDVSQDRSTLYVHAIDVGDDPEDEKEAMKRAFEVNIMEAFR